MKEKKQKTWEDQQKTNSTLQTVSQVSSIVGTVASAGSVITAGVATGLITNLNDQIQKCKNSF